MAGVSFLWLLLPATFAANDAPLPVLADFDPQAFYEKYYEIGTYPQWWEAGCSNTALTFAQDAEPPLFRAKVTIECDRGWFHPKVSGTAVPFDDAEPARALVTVKPPIGKTVREEFDIIMAADDYDWVVIGHPSRKLLWILSRTPQLSTYQLVGIFEELRQAFGYSDIYTQLSCTKHKEGDLSQCQNATNPQSFWHIGDYLRQLIGRR